MTAPDPHQIRVGKPSHRTLSAEATNKSRRYRLGSIEKQFVRRTTADQYHRL
jgi:hypothetical protein